MMNSFVRLWLVLSLALIANLAYCAETDSISLAGQQRMLSQRIVKAWCQVGLGVQPEISKAQLDAAVRSFDDNMSALERKAEAPQLGTALASLRNAWTPLRAAATGVVRQADAAALDVRAEAVHTAAERLIHLLQEEEVMPMIRSIHLVDRLRALSQRFIKIYMLQQWKVNNPALRQEAVRVQSEFAGVLANMQLRVHSPALLAELDSISLQWEWLRAVLLTEGAESFRLIMAEGGEALLQLADQVTRLYKQSAR